MRGTACASLRRRMKVFCDKPFHQSQYYFAKHFAPTRCHNKAISARPMKRLSAAFEQVLLGDTAYCRRPPRPKPNENPSPYVVRLSLCYGIGRPHPFANAVCLRVGSPFFSHKVNVEASKSLCENSTYSASFVRQASLIRKTCTASFMGALTEKRGFRWRIFYYCQTLARSAALPCSNSIFKA